MKKTMKTKSPTAKPKSLTVMHIASKTVALPDAAHVPEVPVDHKPLDGSARLGLLRVYGDQEAETQMALEELSTKHEELVRSLGPLAPETGEAKTLLDRMVAARELNKKAQKLAEYADEQAQLANHAAMAFLTSVVADIEHVATKRPGVAEQFALTLEVMKQRRGAIAAGIARSKAASKSAPETTAKAPEPAIQAPETTPAAPANL